MKKIVSSIPFSFSFALLFFLAAYLFYNRSTEEVLPTINKFENILHKKEIRLANEMLNLAKQAETQSYAGLFLQKPDYYNTLLQNEGLAILIYENDTLKFWTDNSIAVENWIKEVCLDTKMVTLHNGFFEVMKPTTNAHTTKSMVGLVLLKNEFPYQNNYLQNDFQKDFEVPPNTKIVNYKTANAFEIKSNTGDYLFSLQLRKNENANTSFAFIASILNALGFIFLFLFLKLFFLAIKKGDGKNIQLILFTLTVFLLRYLSLRYLFPSCFYTYEFFAPHILADSTSIWKSSLGDLFINVLILMFVVLIFISDFDFKKILQIINNKYLQISIILFLGLYFFLSILITDVFVGIIKNSNIPFGINDLFSLNMYSYTSIIIIGLLLLIYFLIANSIVNHIIKSGIAKRQTAAVMMVTSVMFTIIAHLLGIRDLIILFFPIIVIATIAFIKIQKVNFPFSSIIILVFIYSLYTSHIVIKYSRIKEIESRKIYVQKLADEQDPVAELLFKDIALKLAKDSVLSEYVSGKEKQISDFEKRLKQQYFSGYWEKYEVCIALFDSMCIPIMKANNPAFDNTTYFDELIKNKGKTTACEHFYFITNSTGKISYLAKLPFYKNSKYKQKFGTIYLELDAKFIYDEIGFPELLLDKNIALSAILSNYAYAKYKQNKLINQFGKFNYTNSGNDFENKNEQFEIIKKEDYIHLLYRPNSETLVILSKRGETNFNKITTFSYLFTFFSLMLLIILFVRQMINKAFSENFTFKYRIQILLVIIILISLALFGGGTIYYSKQQFEFKNRENINEKIHSVMMELETKLSNENNLTNDLADYVSFLLKRTSNIFFTDINIYDLKGNLYASSRSKVFDEGLTSKKMNPEAYLQIAILGKTEFIHDERIGKLEFLSSYLPFKNKEGRLLAYLNLPYFAKQSELQKEISGFLVALINIYVLLFALSILSAILISNYVTKPLKLIQDKLSKIKLGKTNEPIEWQEKDEIGNLVSEYNRMIFELAKSAELLAKSERESAWREMAKQVAHEIKNPLTPMKLSLQHLQRTFKDGAPDMDKKMDQLTRTIIEQIDTLSSIATEFSNFAAMPKIKLEKVSIPQIVQNSISLFVDAEKMYIEFVNVQSLEAVVLADKEQLLRVFNNLIKNAVQSITENTKGKIVITLVKDNKNYVISIEDNGEGIKEEFLDKIFTPNFTTKSAGMGLGLAVVKSCVDSINGKIWFETNTQIGTTFYISIPCLNS